MPPWRHIVRIAPTRIGEERTARDNESTIHCPALCSCTSKIRLNEPVMRFIIIFATSLCFVLSIMTSTLLSADQTKPLQNQFLDLSIGNNHDLIKTPCFENPIIVLPDVYLGAWEDTTELCSAIDAKPNADVLDIGTGNGVPAITALERRASFVVATDINPKAVENARLNAQMRGYGDRFDARLVPEDNPGAFSLIGDNERFDLIMCNCPSFDAHVDSYDEANAFDPGHMLVISLIKGLKAHLKPGGKLLMTFWSIAGLDLVKKLAAENDCELTVLKTVSPQDRIPNSPQAPDRNKLYKVPMDKVKDALTGREQTLILKITPFQHD